MRSPTTKLTATPRLEYLMVKNYRALKNLELRDITPLTVLLGRNGSGKSTIFDVFAFLSECFTRGLRHAWDSRNRFKELRTRGETGPIVIELKYREAPKTPLRTYHLAINENSKGPYVQEEWLKWRRYGQGRPFKFLDFKQGSGEVISGEKPDESEKRIFEELESPDMIAVNTLGQFAKHPRASALRHFITDWYLSYLSADAARGIPQAGPEERLSSTGDNLPNVIQYLKEQHPEILNEILISMSRRVPHVERIDADLMEDGRLLLQIKDAPFEKPVLARFASDGTIKMLAYLTLLYDPEPPQLIGIEEPENYLHPRLLPELAEECMLASERSQLLITTHSPNFINNLDPKEVWILHRDNHGFTVASRTSDIPSVKDFIEEGAKLGNLWLEGFLEETNNIQINSEKANQN